MVARSKDIWYNLEVINISDAFKQPRVAFFFAFTNKTNGKDRGGSETPFSPPFGGDPVH